MVTKPSWLESPAGQALTSVLPRAIFTMTNSSFTVTSPSRPQSPVHATGARVGEAVGGGGGGGEGDGVAVDSGEVDGDGVGCGNATRVGVSVAEGVGVRGATVTVAEGVGVTSVFAKTARALSKRPAT